jgi:hypothetical protein
MNAIRALTCTGLGVSHNFDFWFCQVPKQYPLEQKQTLALVLHCLSYVSFVNLTQLFLCVLWHCHFWQVWASYFME